MAQRKKGPRAAVNLLLPLDLMARLESWREAEGLNRLDAICRMLDENLPGGAPIAGVNLLERPGALSLPAIAPSANTLAIVPFNPPRKASPKAPKK